jgi:hypothetical protein
MATGLSALAAPSGQISRIADDYRNGGPLMLWYGR